MASLNRVQISKIGKTSSLGDEDVMVIERKADNKYLTNSVTLKEIGDFLGISKGGGGGGTKTYTAEEVSYSNALSELEAYNVQDALDELAKKIKEVQY